MKKIFKKLCKRRAHSDSNRANPTYRAGGSQSGSIMLEVVAVLALMGVMGAMLFRQIYQRNQELHNIQMASEIRTVKEAVAAYIQATRSFLLATGCPQPESPQDIVLCNLDPDELNTEVAKYLPDGWFTAENPLGDAYTITIWNYYQGDDETRRVIYGIVVPTVETLPASGWNFRRAARVALLVGADGGAYGPGITNCSDDDMGDTCIHGSLGSWEIGASDTGANPADFPDGVYVATTGLDVFVPETDGGKGEVNLPGKDFSLALRDLHAYSYFSVGNSKGPDGCYSIEHSKIESGLVKSDEVTQGFGVGSCYPLFWVGAGDNTAAPSEGNVYVATDLNVGEVDPLAGKHNEALKLTAEGVIRQKDGLTIDKDGRIISKQTVSATVGDVTEGERFVVDPAYTSTMNDIRLTSRGGVRLSDILPNYILKGQEELSCTIPKNKQNCSVTFTQPSCPSEYKKAVVIIPLQFGFNMVNASTGDAGSVTATATISDHKHTIPSSGSETGATGGVTATADISDHTHPITRRQFQIGITANHVKGIDQTDTLTATVGYATSLIVNETIVFIVQTYCVWSPALLGNKEACEAAGYTWNTSSGCTTTRRTAAEADGTNVKSADRYSTRELCLAAGYTWSGTKCIMKFNTTPNAITTAAGCKAAGYVWNGGACSAPSP